MVNNMQLSKKQFNKLYITGADKKTEWLLPWFEENFTKHNPDAQLAVYEFDTFAPELKGWFKKPAAMMDASGIADQVVWLDTDCEIKGNLDGIFNYIQSKKLTMAIDRPWTTRRSNRGTWYNSGVVGFEGIPPVLSEWARYIKEGLTNEVGDQEVLNWMLGGDPIREITHMNTLPPMYNFLRLDIQDKYPNFDKAKIVHWTGNKGKEVIKEMMNV